MLPKIICITVLVAWPRVLGYEDGDRPSPEYRGENYDDSFGSYKQDYDQDVDPVRVKRLEARPTVKTLSPQEIQQVRGAIKQILSGYNQNNPFTPLPLIQPSNEKRSIPDYHVIHKARSAPTSQESFKFDATTKYAEYTDVIDATKSEAQTFTNEPLITDNTDPKTSTVTTYEDYDTVSSNDYIHGTLNSLSSLPMIPGTNIIKPDTFTASTTEIATYNDETAKTAEIINYDTESNSGLTGATINVFPLATLPLIGRTDTGNNNKPDINMGKINENAIDITPHDTATEDKNKNELDPITPSILPTRSHEPDLIRDKMPESTEITTLADNVDSTENLDLVENLNPAEKQDSSKKEESTETYHDVEETSKEKKEPEESEEEAEEGAETSTWTTTKFKRKPGNGTTMSKKTTRTKTTSKRTTRTTTTKFKLDVPALLAIIANLTYDYEVNLTDKLNATLVKYSIPTCETPTTTVKRGIFIDYDANATGTIVAKCFVCGLENYGIPRDAHCADAFAGDFLPLMPVDMTARGKISKFRKYCRYADVPGQMKNISQPRSVFGRWTGGCSVRWIDLSGVYTQRSCRNRERAIMGRNFASKRMAKLEMALKNVDNGCITSPMATLVPLSRGISLYARFHACVCTGSWCNVADIRIPWTAGGLLPLLLTYVSPHLMI